MEAYSKGAICLLDSTVIEIKNNLTTTFKNHKKFEISGESGIRFAQVIIPINDFISVGDIKGYTRLPNGETIELTKFDIGTTSAPGFGGFGGHQAVIFSLRTPTPGSIIYYQYKLKIKSLLYLPRISRRTEYPTNRLVVDVKWGKKVGIRYDAEGMNEAPSKDGILFWAENLPELPDEPLSCPERLHLSLSSDQFTYGKNRYLSRNWPEVGWFYSRLAAQPPDALPLLRDLVARLGEGSVTRRDTIAALFNFLADSVSYVALQVGKGDFAPHTCQVILKRRFGDCKDQATLLSSLCQVAGIEAYPALVFTGDYPRPDSLWPWPAWFDHVVTVVRDPSGDMLLDPSDPSASLDYLPSSLRGKCYLVCDGRSDLVQASLGPDPAFGIFWNFRLLSGGEFDAAYKIRYVNDAAGLYGNLWAGKDTVEIKSYLMPLFRQYGWNVSGLALDDIINSGDSLVITGFFPVEIDSAGDSRSLAVASPLTAYLLETVFPEVRRGDYCRTGSLALEETIIFDYPFQDLQAGTGYSDSWSRRNLAFTDEMMNDHQRVIYHRLFSYAGGVLAAADYNAFRDFLLSRRDQQYVRFRK